MSDYDVIVVGGGTAGTAAAASARHLGASTLLINDGELGGLCILRGCMPTKSMLAAAHAVHEARRLEPFGARLRGSVDVDFEAVIDRKDAHVARFLRAKLASIERQRYEILDARARFVGPDSVEANGRRLRAGAFVLATGSTPVILPLPGIEDVPVWTSDDVMKLRSRPRRLLVQGAGFVGLELAQFFARVGTEVTLVNRSPLLIHTDPDCGRELDAALREEDGLRLHVPGRIERLRRHGTGLIAELDGGEEIVADALLMAVGRRAALDGLGLDTAGVEVDGATVRRDEGMRTTNPRVWVAGDVTGTDQVLHVANEEGRVAGFNAAGGKPPRRLERRFRMFVVFTDPPCARVGITEDEARAAGLDVVVAQARFPKTGRAITMNTRHGLWKLVVERDGGRILGSSIVGPRADDLVHTISTMMYFGGKIGEIEKMPWYHPTLSEVLVNLFREARAQLA